MSHSHTCEVCGDLFQCALVDCETSPDEYDLLCDRCYVKEWVEEHAV